MALNIIAGLVPAISLGTARTILIEMAGTGPAVTTRNTNQSDRAVLKS
jgi:hypothetical protein